MSLSLYQCQKVLENQMCHVFDLSVLHDMSEMQSNDSKGGFKEMLFLNFLRC